MYIYNVCIHSLLFVYIWNIICIRFEPTRENDDTEENKKEIKVQLLRYFNIALVSVSPNFTCFESDCTSNFVSGSVFVCGCVCASAGRCVRRLTRRVCAFKSAFLCRSSSSFCVSDALVCGTDTDTYTHIHTHTHRNTHTYTHAGENKHFRTYA